MSFEAWNFCNSLNGGCGRGAIDRHVSLNGRDLEAAIKVMADRKADVGFA
jgi:hypothetical protein